MPLRGECTEVDNNDKQLTILAAKLLLPLVHSNDAAQSFVIIYVSRNPPNADEWVWREIGEGMAEARVGATNSEKTKYDLMKFMDDEAYLAFIRS